MIVASAWRAYSKSTLQGFVTLTLRPSGLVLRDCSLHEKEGRRWIGLPMRPQLDRDGKQLVSLKDNKPCWSQVVDFESKDARERLQAAALAAVDRLIGRGSAP